MYVSFNEFLEQLTISSSVKNAIVYDGKGYSWADIDRMASAAAFELLKKNVAPKSHIAICGANSINWIVTFFAAQKIGTIAVLVNPGLCTKELCDIIEYADISCFCYGEIEASADELTAACKNKGTAFMSFADDEDFSGEEIPSSLKNTVLADDPCVMIFTSGTTGKLKGVILSSYNILNAAQINREDQTLNQSDKSCVILPFFHIFGLIAGLFANAIAHSAIYMPKERRTAQILNIIENERCTVFHSVPTMLIAIINNKNFTPEKVSSLRCTIVSGATASRAQTERFVHNMPANHFLTSYGLSEMAPVSITKYNDSLEHILSTVGKPIKNIRIKINSPNENGEGEILIRGFNLMLGYYKLSLDEQPIDAEGWLHTGDLGKINAEGYLEFKGRIKEIIIRGGENIYPMEVEKAISEHQNIVDVKVIGVSDEFYGEEVCACIRPKVIGEFNEDEMRAFLKGRIAKYKIPKYFMVYKDFPLLENGKLNIMQLKEDFKKA